MEQTDSEDYSQEFLNDTKRIYNVETDIEAIVILEELASIFWEELGNGSS